MPRTRRRSRLDGIAALGLALGSAMLSACASTNATATAPAGGPAQMPLTCTLTAPPKVAAGQPVRLSWSVRNTGQHAVDVLVWGTPFESRWFAPYLGVEFGGSALRYGGASMKRGDPQPTEYVRIDAGQVRDASIDLSAVFDLTQPGRYRVQPKIVLHDLVVVGQSRAPRPRDEHVGLPLPCNAVEFEITRP